MFESQPEHVEGADYSDLGYEMNYDGPEPDFIPLHPTPPLPEISLRCIPSDEFTALMGPYEMPVDDDPSDTERSENGGLY